MPARACMQAAEDAGSDTALVAAMLRNQAQATTDAFRTVRYGVQRGRGACSLLPWEALRWRAPLKMLPQWVQNHARAWHLIGVQACGFGWAWKAEYLGSWINTGSTGRKPAPANANAVLHSSTHCPDSRKDRSKACSRLAGWLQVCMLWLASKQHAASLAWVLTAQNVAYFALLWHVEGDLAVPVVAAVVAATAEMALVVSKR